MQADNLSRRADDVKATAAQSGIPVAPVAAKPLSTQQKIEEFYGVRQLPEGILFVAHFPSAKTVGIAGDFNNWTPQHMDASVDADTFRTLMPLKSGRYRYRLVVDGRWQADPHNVYAEPNPFGELDSVVEVL